MPPITPVPIEWRLADFISELRRYRPIVWFLAAYWLYIDGVNTVIKMAVDYGLSLGFDQSHLIREFRHMSGLRPGAYAPVSADQPTHVALPR